MTQTTEYEGNDKKQPVPGGYMPGDELLGVYTVDSKPISGGMGSVWRVYHNGWNAMLAMKQPHRQLFEDGKARSMFISECRVWMELGLHPNAVTCYYVREVDGTPAIFSEWIDGGSLKDAIASNALYEGDSFAQTQRILDIAIQFARGLMFAHESGLIHSDVKPDNLLLTREGVAKVADFGIAKARAVLTVESLQPSETAGEKTLSAHSGGFTPKYCSMEQITGGTVTRRTDIYSWAVSVLEMLCGSAPWMNGVVAGLSCEEYLDSARVVPADRLRSLLIACMKDDPDERPHDFSIIERELCGIYEECTGNTYPRKRKNAGALLADSCSNRAISYADIGDDARARRYFEKALAADKLHGAAVYNHALWQWRHCEIDDYEAARRVDALSGDTAKRLRNELYLESCTPLTECYKRLEGRDTEWIYRANELSMNDLIVMPDGSGIVTSGWDACARMWDVKTGERRLEIGKVDEKRFNMCLSSDGSLLFTHEGKRICAYCTDTKKKAYEIDTGEVFTCFAVDADAKYAYTGGYSNEIRMYNMETGCLEHVFERRTVFTKCIVSAGGYMANTNFRSIEIFDRFDGTVRRVLTGFERDVICLYVSADKQLLIAGSDDNTARAFRLSDGECVMTYRAHANSVISACISNDNKLVATVSADSTVKLFDAYTGRCMRTMRAQAYTAMFSPDSKHLHITMYSGCVVSVSVGDFKYRAAYEVCRVNDTALMLEQAQQFKSLYESASDAYSREDINKALEFTARARKLPGYGRDSQCMELMRAMYRRCTKVKLGGAWHVRTQKLHTSYVSALAYDKDGTLYSGGNSNTIGMWDAEGNVNTFKTGVGNTASMAVAGSYLIISGTNGGLECYDTHGKLMHRVSDTKSMASFIGISPDKTRAALCMTDHTLRIVSIPELLELERMRFDESCTCAEFLPDGSGLLICVGNGTAQIFKKTKKGYEAAQSFTGSKEFFAFNQAHLSCDGERVFLNTDKRLLALATTRSMQPLRPASGHNELTTCTLLSAEGRFAVSGGTDKYAIVWDMKNGTIAATFSEHTQRVLTLALSHDGAYLATGGEDGDINVYRLDWELDFPGFTDWDERADIYVSNYAKTHPNKAQRDVAKLYDTLERVGLGYIRHGGVDNRLSEYDKKFGGIFGRFR